MKPESEMAVQDILGPDKRRYARFEVLECAMIQGGEAAEPMSTVVVDIGLGGVQLRSREVLPVGSECRLLIGSHHGKTIELRGEVRYSRPMRDSDLVASGFRFMPATHEERLAVAEYVHGVFTRQADQLDG